MYTYWKRTVVPPVMATFDGSGREMCRVRPRRTNTPLQALTLMNDVTFVEAARILAQRAMVEHQTPADRLASMFRRVLARTPGARELQVLHDGLERHLDEFHRHPQDARQLISAGEYPLDESLDASQLAAYTTIASLLLNLDEAVTKQ